MKSWWIALGSIGIIDAMWIDNTFIRVLATMLVILYSVLLWWHIALAEEERVRKFPQKP